MITKYGIKTVVGGWHRKLSDEELIPYTLARTAIEHRQLRKLISMFMTSFHVQSRVAEFGCGYGRNLDLLREFANEVIGWERDEELATIAKDIWKADKMISVGQGVLTEFCPRALDMVLSYTVLQHIIDDEECKKVAANMQNALEFGGTAIICEEQDKSLRGSVVGRTQSEYCEMFNKCKLIHVETRKAAHGVTTGQFLIFRRIS